MLILERTVLEVLLDVIKQLSAKNGRGGEVPPLSNRGCFARVSRRDEGVVGEHELFAVGKTFLVSIGQAEVVRHELRQTAELPRCWS